MNSLPPHILQSQTLHSFRRHLKTFYFQSAYPAPNAPWFSSETLALYKSLTYLLTYYIACFSAIQVGYHKSLGLSQTSPNARRLSVTVSLSSGKTVIYAWNFLVQELAWLCIKICTRNLHKFLVQDSWLCVISIRLLYVRVTSITTTNTTHSTPVHCVEGGYLCRNWNAHYPKYLWITKYYLIVRQAISWEDRNLLSSRNTVHAIDGRYSSLNHFFRVNTWPRVYWLPYKPHVNSSELSK